ncbi:MAG TPA: preprotein translocase subunit SecG [Candidatus Paceibacterota bacterium]|nr:preprotein translocase subunit SecG [Candidatus Paceibacterota bacterium]
MQVVSTVLPYVQIALAALLTGFILLQQRGASLGGAFGGGDGFGYNTRRGAEKVLFNATIAVAVFFVASTLIALIIK